MCRTLDMNTHIPKPVVEEKEPEKEEKKEEEKKEEDKEKVGKSDLPLFFTFLIVIFKNYCYCYY